MVMSMTGYGRESKEMGSFSVAVEVKSVNHRFSEISVYLPRPFMVYEEKVKRLSGKYIQRGKVDVYISVAGEGLYDRSLNVDWDLLSQYIETLKEARNRFSLSGEVTVEDLLKVPDAFAVTNKDGAEQLEEVLLDAAGGALEQLLEMRKAEGLHLRDDLQERLDKIESSVNVLTEHSPKVTAYYQERLSERVKTFLDGKTDIDEARILNEVAVFSDKADISEELTRLRSHVLQFRKYLKEEGPIGKKLNFLQQEMNREANTIGAKGNDFDISVHVVELKSELEKIKEQIQNIE
ncbi:MAG TPA: YicC/YloC family endoribonuclease [Bacillales bacterium]|nr:YicC/YloC family endoribonuclease [Bacillales bacterium]